jgi:hypothetical protein
MKNNLKKIVSLSSALLFAGIVTAQDTVRVRERVIDTESKDKWPPLRNGEFGIRYMPTFSAFDVMTLNGDVVQGSITMSHGLGIMLAGNFNRHIGIQGEVNYYQSAQSFKDASLDRQLKVSYLNIPVLLSLNTDKRMPVNLNVVVGPQFGINVGSSISTTGSENAGTLRATVGLKQGDVGLAYGAGLEFALNRDHTFRLDLGYRGYYGLIDVNTTDNGNGTYNIIVKTVRKTNGGYIGLTWLF